MRLSVIVPLAPGEAEWRDLAGQLEDVLDQNCELLLVAAGERVAWQSKVPLKLLASEVGRARQLNVGAQAAHGDFLWFLHADTRLSPGAWPAVQAFMARGEKALGWFDLAFRSDGPLPVRLNAMGANFRSRYLGIPFGDQGFVMPALLFAEVGGFNEQAAYGEDHLFVWAVRHAGYRVVPVEALLSTSARKYARYGWVRTTLRHLWLTAVQAYPQWRALRR
jgi:rSAM/selenodomain-associated transferase 2